MITQTYGTSAVGSGAKKASLLGQTVGARSGNCCVATSSPTTLDDALVGCLLTSHAAGHNRWPGNLRAAAAPGDGGHRRATGRRRRCNRHTGEPAARRRMRTATNRQSATCKQTEHGMESPLSRTREATQCKSQATGCTQAPDCAPITIAEATRSFGKGRRTVEQTQLP